MTILLEGPCKNKTNKTSDLTTLGQNLNFPLSCIDLDRIMAEMSISWEQLSNQAPLVSLHHLKITAGDFKPQGKVSDGLRVATENYFQSICRCPLSFPEGTVALEPDFVCVRFLPCLPCSISDFSAPRSCP